MYVSLNWVKKYVDLPKDLSVDQLIYDLTMRTVEVEGYENPADKYHPKDQSENWIFHEYILQ